MPEFRRSRIIGFILGIWTKSRNALSVVMCISVAGILFHLFLPDNLRITAVNSQEFSAASAVNMLYFHLVAISILLVLAIFGFTEFNAQKSTAGFPSRLFVLPVTSFELITLPMVSGVVAIELAAWPWRLVLLPLDRSYWVPVLLGTYMIVYQTVLWTMPALRAFRMLLLGLLGVVFMMLPILPFFHTWSQRSLTSLLFALAGAAFFTSWFYVAGQRSGGRSRPIWTFDHTARHTTAFYRNQRPFASPMSAQFWFEWRRSGRVLPTLVAGILCLVIGPLSWAERNNVEASLLIFGITLAMPCILSLAVGKAFSKPDFWSGDLSMPPFLAVRPVATPDLIQVKMKVAAAATEFSWLTISIFLSAWLLLWAPGEMGLRIRSLAVQVISAPVYARPAVVVLSIFALACITWRFLVGSLWLGLSGNKTVFALTAIPYAVLPFFVMAALIFLARHQQTVSEWLFINWNEVRSLLTWIFTVVLVVKFCGTAFFWRTVGYSYLHRYLIWWSAATALLLALALYISSNVAILFALAAVPLACIGFATSSLMSNRHR